MEERVTTDELIKRAIEISPKGFQISLRYGALNFTRAIYYRKNLIFYFDISEDFSFRKANGYTIEEFEKDHKNWQWIIEMTF